MVELLIPVTLECSRNGGDWVADLIKLGSGRPHVVTGAQASPGVELCLQHVRSSFRLVLWRLCRRLRARAAPPATSRVHRCVVGFVSHPAPANCWWCTGWKRRPVRRLADDSQSAHSLRLSARRMERHFWSVNSPACGAIYHDALC